MLSDFLSIRKSENTQFLNWTFDNSVLQKLTLTNEHCSKITFDNLLFSNIKLEKVSLGPIVSTSTGIKSFNK